MFFRLKKGEILTRRWESNWEVVLLGPVGNVVTFGPWWTGGRLEEGVSGEGEEVVKVIGICFFLIEENGNQRSSKHRVLWFDYFFFGV